MEINWIAVGWIIDMTLNGLAKGQVGISRLSQCALADTKLVIWFLRVQFSELAINGCIWSICKPVKTMTCSSVSHPVAHLPAEVIFVLLHIRKGDCYSIMAILLDELIIHLTVE